MVIKDLLVHLDETPASERRLQAALALAAPVAPRSPRCI